MYQGIWYHVEFVPLDLVPLTLTDTIAVSVVMALGHFDNGKIISMTPHWVLVGGDGVERVLVCEK